MRGHSPRAASSHPPAPPLVDLHLHLEGSLPPAVVRELARRHRIPAPPLTGFAGFTGFLKAFGAVCDLLRDRADFRTAAGGVIDRCAALGIEHVEILFSPQIFLRRGIPLEAVMEGLLEARDRRRARRPSVVYILDGVRQWGGEWLEATLRQAAPWAGRGLGGAGIGGDERALSCRSFAGAYALARSLGLRTTVHAGEAAGPEAIRDALRWLRPDRIGHGIAAARDAALAAELRARRIPLEICPASNRATGVVPRSTPHPVRDLLDGGLNVTIGSDDGSFFDCDVRSEIASLVREAGLTVEEAARLQRNAARAAFLPGRRRRTLERRIAKGWDQFAAAAARRDRALA